MKTKPILEKSILARLKKERTIIAASRDRLRELCGEIEAVEDVARDGVESLDYAIDRLSEYV